MFLPATMEAETEITGRLIDAVVKTLSPDVCTPQMRAHIAQQLGLLLKPNPTPVHPPYALMIREAIVELNEEGGSDEEAISNSIKIKYESLPWGHKSLLSHHLKKLSDVGEIVHGSDGRFMLLPEEESDDSTTDTQEEKRTSKNLQNGTSANQHKVSSNDSSRSPEKEVGGEQEGALAEPGGVEGRDQFQEKLMQVNEPPNPDVTDFPSLDKILGTKASEEVCQVTKEQQAQERTGDAFVVRARSQERQAPPNAFLEPEMTNAHGLENMLQVEASEEIRQVFEGGQSEKLGGADQALGEISLAVEGEREEGTAPEKENNDAVDSQGQLQEESNHFHIEEDQAGMQEACRLADQQDQENGVTEKVNLENQIDEQSHDALVETQLVEMMEQQTQSEKQQTVTIGTMRQLLEKEKEIEGIEKLIASVGQSAEVIGNGASLQEKQVDARSRIADNRPILSCTFSSLRQGGSSHSLKDKCLELINRTKKIRKWTEETDKCIFGIMKSLSTAEISPNRKLEICVPLKKVISHNVASPDCSEVIDVMMIEAQNSRCFRNSKRPSESPFTALENLSLRQEKRLKLSEQQDTVNFPSTLEYSQQLVRNREHQLLKASEANYSCETTLSLSLAGSSSLVMPLAASFPALRNEVAGFGTVQSNPPHGAAKAVTFHLETGETTVPVMPDLSKELTVASFALRPQMQHQEARAFKEGKEPDFEIGNQQQELEMMTQDIDKEGQEQQGRLLAHQQHKQLDAEENVSIFTAGTSPLVNSEQAELQWRLLNCEQHKHFVSEENAIPTSTGISLPPISYELSVQQRSLPTQWQRKQLEHRSNAMPTLSAVPRPPINYELSEQRRGLPIQQQRNQFEPVPNTAPTLVARPQLNCELTEQQGILSSSMYHASPAEVTTPTLFSAILSQGMGQQQQALLVSEVCTPYPNAEFSREHHPLEEQVSGLPVIDSSRMKPSALSSGTLTPLKPAELEMLVCQTKEPAARLQTPKKSRINGQGSRTYKKKLRPRVPDDSLPEHGTPGYARILWNLENPEKKEKKPRGRPRKLKPETGQESAVSQKRFRRPRKSKPSAAEEPPTPKTGADTTGKEGGSASPSPQKLCPGMPPMQKPALVTAKEESRPSAQAYEPPTSLNMELQ